MRIIDPQKLVPNESVINDVIASHPGSHAIKSAITSIIVREADAESINLDGTTLTLYLQESSGRRENFRYVLYHEFYHIVDRLNLKFEYYDDIKHSLTPIEQLNLMELWNLFIDARLHKRGLFELDENDKGLYGTVNGRLQKIPFTIEGKQLRHISFLASRGVVDAEELVREIWANPPTVITYGTLAKLAMVEEHRTTSGLGSDQTNPLK